jgi:shikimate kinase
MHCQSAAFDGRPVIGDERTARWRPAVASGRRTASGILGHVNGRRDAALVPPRTISLIGMPGGGKSTVGRYLARQLGLLFRDTDHEIESVIGCTIRDFFASHGEAAFRDLEQEAVDVLTQGKPIVLGTGGGVVLREANRRALRERTTVIYLRSTPEELVRRLRHDTQRPLLQGGDPLLKLRQLYRERDPLYRRTAHYTIDTGRPSVSALVHMILMQLELAGLVDPARVPSPISAPHTPRGGTDEPEGR